MNDSDENLTDPRIASYALEHSSTELPVLQRLARTTHLRTHLPQMLSGCLQGQLLQMISHMLKPAAILEIGTFTGYSAICLAQGLRPGGRLITIDCNPEMMDFAAPFFAEAGLSGSIQMITGDALEVIPRLDGPFDLVFIDAGKEDYTRFFDLVLVKVSPGGIVLADNTLWYGKVLDAAAADPETESIRLFNRHILAVPGIEVLMLPLRDGITVIRKLPS